MRRAAGALASLCVCAARTHLSTHRQRLVLLVASFSTYCTLESTACTEMQPGQTQLVALWLGFMRCCARGGYITIDHLPPLPDLVAITLVKRTVQRLSRDTRRPQIQVARRTGALSHRTPAAGPSTALARASRPTRRGGSSGGGAGPPFHDARPARSRGGAPGGGLLTLPAHLATRGAGRAATVAAWGREAVAQSPAYPLSPLHNSFCIYEQ